MSREGELTTNVDDLPYSDGAATSQHQGVDNTSQISGTYEERSLKDRSPYVPECEVFDEVGGPEANELLETCARNCKKKDFIPVKEFTTDHLPEWCRDERTWKGFERLCLLTDSEAGGTIHL